MTEILITSSILILSLTLLRLVGNRVSARLRYALWGLVALRLLLPAGLIPSSVSIMNFTPAPEAYATPSSPPVGAIHESPADGTPDAPAVIPPPAPEPSMAPAPKISVAPTTPVGPSLSTFLGWGWLAGACAVGGYFLLSNLLFYRRLRREAQPRWEVDSPLPVYRADFLPSPCMAGLFRPAIYLNMDAITTETGLRHVLAHEYCHKRHGDNWWALLRCLCLALWWFHPLVWLAAWLSRRDCELACDESALALLGEEERIPYGKTLMGLTARPAPADLLRASTAMTAGKGALKERISCIARRRSTKAATLLAAALALVLAACTLTGENVAPPVLPTPAQSDPQAVEPSPLSDRKENFFTFLVVGRDTHGGGNTDTMLLAAYDLANQNLSFMSLPRDTLINVSWDIKKLNSVYNMYGGGEKGMEALKEQVGKLVGFTPDFTVTVEWDAVGELVDAIGGVDFDVPRDMYYNDLSQNFVIDLKKGRQTLNGSQAMQLIRYRHDSDDAGHILSSGYPDGDLGRIKVQQDFLKAAISQCLEEITDAGTVLKLAGIFVDHVTTDLTVGNLIWFGKAALFGEGTNKRLSMENVSFITMPWVNADQVWSRTYNIRPSYVAPDADTMTSFINGQFNPYTTDLSKDEFDIMYVNPDGTLGCTGGKLEDTGYNAWVLKK